MKKVKITKKIIGGKLRASRYWLTDDHWMIRKSLVSNLDSLKITEDIKERQIWRVLKRCAGDNVFRSSFKSDGEVRLCLAGDIPVQRFCSARGAIPIFLDARFVEAFKLDRVTVSRECDCVSAHGPRGPLVLVMAVWLHEIDWENLEIIKQKPVGGTS